MYRFWLLIGLIVFSSGYRFASAETGDNLDEPLQLTIHFHFRNRFSWNPDWPVAQEVERLTGVHLQPVGQSATGNSRERFDRVMQEDVIPDIVGGDGLKEAFNQYGMQGKLMPLNRLIAQHAPNIQRVLDQKPLVRAYITAPDGNIYFIPYIPSGIAGRGYFIRQDWLNRLDLEVPQTVDELESVLIAFRDNDPNGNGLKDEIPYFNRHPEEVIRLVNFFGARSTGSDRYHDFVVEDQQVSHPYLKEEFRFAVKRVAAWYRDGLIDSEIFGRGSAARTELLSQDLGGMTHDWFASTASYNDSLSRDIPGFEFLPFMPPADINGKVMEEHGRAQVKPDGWAIGANNANPVETMRYFDFYFSELGRMISNFGVKGKTFKVFMAEPRFTKEVLNSDRSVLNQMLDIGAQIPIGFYQDYNYERQWTNPIAMKGIDAYAGREVIEQPFPGVTLSVEEKAIYDRHWPEIERYMVAAITRWVSGESDVNEEWSEYLSTLTAMGSETVLDVMNQAYQRQYGHPK